MYNEQYWKVFQVARGSEMVEVDWIERDAETKEGTIQFEIDVIKQPVLFDIHIELTDVPGIEGYVQKSTLQWRFHSIGQQMEDLNLSILGGSIAKKAPIIHIFLILYRVIVLHSYFKLKMKAVNSFS